MFGSSISADPASIAPASSSSPTISQIVVALQDPGGDQRAHHQHARRIDVRVLDLGRPGLDRACKLLVPYDLPDPARETRRGEVGDVKLALLNDRVRPSHDLAVVMREEAQCLLEGVDV